MKIDVHNSQYLERVYEAIVSGKSSLLPHLPHSSVYYATVALRKRGHNITVEELEQMMYEEGMLSEKEMQFRKDKAHLFEGEKCS